MRIKKGDQWILSDSGKKVTITHVSLMSVGWREKGQITTTHTSRDYFLEMSRKVPVKANTQLKAKIVKTMRAIGGIGSFNKIVSAMQKRSKIEVVATRIRKVLGVLVELGELHYFERSDTYMIHGEQA